MIERLALLALLLIVASAASAQNEELWDLYPAVFQLELDPDTPSAVISTVSWETFGADSSSLQGNLVTFVLEDAQGQMTLVPASGEVIDFTPEAAWQWQATHIDSVFSGDCRFDYMLEFGSILIEAGEGYRIGQREALSWTGADGSCPDIVRWYLDQALRDPDFAWHLADWPTALGGYTPGESGSFRLALNHDLRKSRRLLPLPDSGEVGADPVPGILGSIGDGPERFGSIAGRIGVLVFASGFE